MDLRTESEAAESLHLDERVLKLMPKLTGAERQNICDEPPEFTACLLDGKWTVIGDPHVYELWREMGKEVTPDMVRLLELAGWDAIKEWIVTHTLIKRRHLNKWQRICLAMTMRDNYAAESKARQGARTDMPGKSPECSGDTRDRIAKLARVSGSLVDWCRKLLDAFEDGRLGDQKRRALEEEKISISKAFRELGVGEPHNRSGKKNGSGGRSTISTISKSESIAVPYVEINEDEGLFEETIKGLFERVKEKFADYSRTNEIQLTFTISWDDAPGSRQGARDPNEPPVIDNHAHSSEPAQDPAPDDFDELVDIEGEDSEEDPT